MYNFYMNLIIIHVLVGISYTVYERLYHKLLLHGTVRYVKLIFECSPIWLILGQIGYWDDILYLKDNVFFCIFDLSIITVITVLPEKGQNTGNTTFVHKKMTM